MQNAVIAVMRVTALTISKKGQITLPAEVRRRLGLEPRSRVELEVRGDEVVLRRLGTVAELHGIFAQYAIPGTAKEQELESMEKAVGEEAAHAH